MAIPVSMAIGQHTLLSDPVTRWVVQFADTNPPSVVLTASVQAGPKIPIFSGPAGATSVGLQMDALVAIELYEQLGDLIRSMGWQQNIAGGRPI